ncbi:MAG: hypothetical protein JNL67_00180 [Planctomycetaceae bacterium]|nr:hypothetical protein [Planctomycetaceae bacterium]
MANLRPMIEVAVADVEDAIAAERAGADRLELNSGMPLGGLTPSAGLVLEVLAAVSIPVVVMVRPRPGGFCYTNAQWTTAQRETEWLLSVGAAGIVFGALDADRNIDVGRTTAMRALIVGREFVFHRAFDLAADWSVALHQLIDCQVDRVLSSGQQPEALGGADCLAAMQEKAEHKIEIIAGSGIRSTTIAPLWKLGLRQFHGTFSRAAIDPGYEAARFRFAINDHTRTLDSNDLIAARRLLDQLAAE